MTHVRPHPHELKAELIYPEHGASPNWALRTVFSDVAGQSLQWDIEIAGEHWTITGNIQESGLAPRESDNVSKLYEYRLNTRGPDRKNVPLKLAPRWRGMKKASDGSDAKVPIPPDVDEAVGVSIQTGVNLLPDDYEQLIPEIVAAVAEELGHDWNEDYLRDVHPDSRVVELELYVRVRREIGKKLIASDGIF